jgi:hypothetical protein
MSGTGPLNALIDATMAKCTGIFFFGIAWTLLLRAASFVKRRLLALRRTPHKGKAVGRQRGDDGACGWCAAGLRRMRQPICWYVNCLWSD